MKLSLLFAAGALALGLTSCETKTQPEPFSVRMVKSEINRMPDASMIDFNQQLKWNYTHGLELESMIMTAEQNPAIEQLVWDYTNHYLDTIINEDGSINKYKKSNYTLDHVKPGKMLLKAYDKLQQPRLKTAMDSLYSQLQSHPRTSDGGFWHKKAYPSQMWLDGIYMEAPFYVEYAAKFLEGDEQQAAFDDAVHQIVTCARHTYDPENGLYRHAFDESREMPWSQPSPTGQAPHVWGRALGWYTMAMVDVLEWLPADYSGRDSILTLLNPVCENLLPLQQDDKTWQQVLDQTGREGNYNETSCTAMFAYTFLKGALLGYLPKEYWTRGCEIIDSLNQNYIRQDKDGTISLTRVCGVAGLGGNPYRDGSFDYYVNEIIRDNDPKGVGPYVMACLMVEKYGAELK